MSYMRIYETKVITDDILKAFRKLMKQLSPNNITLPNKIDLEDIVNSNNTIIFIAEENDTVLGTLTLVFNKIPTGNKVWIEDVVVDKVARGRKIGERLTQHAIDYVLNKGITKIDLNL